MLFYENKHDSKGGGHTLKIGIRVKNALTILIYLSKHSRVVSSSELAEYLSTTKNAVLKITKLLATHEIIIAHAGVKGGYTLAKPLNDITLFEVIEAIDSAYLRVEKLGDDLSSSVQETINNQLKSVTLNTFSEYIQ